MEDYLYLKLDLLLPADCIIMVLNKLYRKGIICIDLLQAFFFFLRG